MTREEQDYSLNRIASVLLCCLILSLAFLLLWFVSYVLAGDWTYGISARWFELSRHEFTLVNYWGIAITKIAAIVFFLFPYLSIKFVLRKK